VPDVDGNNLRKRCMRMSAPSRLASHMPEVHSKLHQITASTRQYLVGAGLARAHDYGVLGLARLTWQKPRPSSMHFILNHWRKARSTKLHADGCCPCGQANAAKAKIEERERVARQQAKKSGRPDIEALPPQWFEPDPSAAAAPLGKARRWRYKEGSYWEAREAGSWSSCRRLFDAP